MSDITCCYKKIFCQYCCNDLCDKTQSYAYIYENKGNCCIVKDIRIPF